MKLTDFDKTQFANQALKETYKIDFDVSKMSMVATTDMLKKVRSLALEAKQGSDAQQINPSYMKLVFMEEALVNHYNTLATKRPKIIIENEKIEESQVYLAAQAMVDEVDKMIKTLGKMQVEELPALVTRIETEIGVNESQTFQEQTGGTLDTLSAALKEAQSSLKNAVNQLTGVGGEGFGTEPTGDMGTGLEEPIPGAGEEPVAGDLTAPAEPMPEPKTEPLGGAGRAKR